MEYTLKKLEKEDLHNGILLAYYIFFEKMYGKAVSSSMIRRRLSDGVDLSIGYSLIDGNLHRACEALENNDPENHATLIGAYDDKDSLSAVSRVRMVDYDNLKYDCISEIVPLSEKGRLSTITGVIEAFEKASAANALSDVLLFEVPRNDQEFMEALFKLGFVCEKVNYQDLTFLFTKQLNQNLSVK